MSQQFTQEAAILWSIISKENRQRILENVFCGKCRTTVEMVMFTGKLERGDIILEGSCAVCGARVVRVLETSEQDEQRN
jgi:hypothetical protein